ncbi:MAG: hypothetical protein H6Q42_3646 [Deltaproteobacteria bacterium]|nr:hypothetical protein [Deltaproteobacteria bacterium]
MLKFFLKRQILKNKTLIFHEAQQMQGFLFLLFKERNTESKWTREEKEQIKAYLKRLSAYVPVIILFILPGGSLMLPILAEILDRRKQRRIPDISSVPAN